MGPILRGVNICLTAFASLGCGADGHTHQLPDTITYKHLGEEVARFRLWCANLGARQEGPSSLDERLRDAGVMRSTILKHLYRLEQVLNSIVTSGEEEVDGVNDSISDQSASDTDDQSVASSRASSCNDSQPPRSLSAVLMDTVHLVISELFMLSYKIRDNNNRPNHQSRIRTFTETDLESGIDRFQIHSTYDELHIKESLRQMRGDVSAQESITPMGHQDSFLADRLVSTMNLRRRCIRYRQRHARKLHVSVEQSYAMQQAEQQPSLSEDEKIDPALLDNLESHEHRPTQSISGKTILSATVATKFVEAQNDDTDTRSNISYASTASESLGQGIELPSAPPDAMTQDEFWCPFCSIVISSKQGRGRAWKKHVLYDLQPYFCTYPDCTEGELLYGSRTDWLEHERLSHRRAWKCLCHLHAVFNSKAEYCEHLQAEHDGDTTKSQQETLAKAAECTLQDTRSFCPFCLTSRELEEGLGKHMALHMQRFAIFSGAREASTYDPYSEESDIDQDSNLACLSASVRMSDLSSLPEEISETRTAREVSQEVTELLKQQNDNWNQFNTLASLSDLLPSEIPGSPQVMTVGSGTEDLYGLGRASAPSPEPKTRLACPEEGCDYVPESDASLLQHRAARHRQQSRYRARNSRT